MTLFIPGPPLNRQTSLMRIITALLILGAFLTCTRVVNGGVVEVTVEGTVWAHAKLSQIGLTAFANGKTVGEVALGDFESGQEKPFRVTGNIPNIGAQTLRCHIKLQRLTTTPH